MRRLVPFPAQPPPWWVSAATPWDRIRYRRLVNRDPEKRTIRPVSSNNRDLLPSSWPCRDRRRCWSSPPATGRTSPYPSGRSPETTESRIASWFRFCYNSKPPAEWPAYGARPEGIVWFARGRSLVSYVATYVRRAHIFSHSLGLRAQPAIGTFFTTIVRGCSSGIQVPGSWGNSGGMRCLS